MPYFPTEYGCCSTVLTPAAALISTLLREETALCRRSKCLMEPTWRISCPPQLKKADEKEEMPASICIRVSVATLTSEARKYHETRRMWWGRVNEKI